MERIMNDNFKNYEEIDEFDPLKNTLSPTKLKLAMMKVEQKNKVNGILDKVRKIE